MMMFRPAANYPDQQVELWEGPRLVAVLTAGNGGIHIQCERDYEPALAVEPQSPAGVVITLRRES